MKTLKNKLYGQLPEPPVEQSMTSCKSMCIENDDCVAYTYYKKTVINDENSMYSVFLGKRDGGSNVDIVTDSDIDPWCKLYDNLLIKDRSRLIAVKDGNGLTGIVVRRKNHEIQHPKTQPEESGKWPSPDR